MVNADRPEAHLNLGLLATAAGEPGVAHEAYRTALRLDHGYTPARIKLADLYRELGRDAESEAELEAGLGVDAESADLHFALGLAQGRNQRSEAAVASLARAVELAPENSRYAYVYARVLGSAGRTAEAVPILETAQGGDLSDRDILAALVQFSAELGREDSAKRWLDQLAAMAPDDPIVEQFQTLLAQGAPALPSPGSH
jgi:Tfp pilus assembly protein PilF